MAVVQNIHSVYSKRFAKNYPDSDHFDKDSAITERVAKRCQPGINLQDYVKRNV